MDHKTPWVHPEPTRREIDEMPGPTLLEFGTPWCGFCRGTTPLIEKALAQHAGVRHLRVEDGSGRPLGRSFRVKLWPTLVFLRDGQELARLVRPHTSQAIDEALGAITRA